MDLFEPSSGSQVHDNNAGILPSGLFWTAGLAKGSVKFSADRRKLKASVDAAAIDTFVILGPNATPSEVRYNVELTAIGDRVRRGKGKTVPPTDPGAFIGGFFDARGVGHYSGKEIGFAFETNGAVTTEVTWAELGDERNGVFL